ncbi:MAG TPA: amidohydrolase family protein [Candidatus Angelobacter sp.]|nr:amidohydrolase family protein [Candidatus Angelobacter sp.]
MTKSTLRLAFIISIFVVVAGAQQKPSAPAKAATLDANRPIAITGGKLLTITHGTIENGVLVIDKGKIVAVGAAASVKLPANAQIIDAKGMTVYPGLIDSESHLGLTEVEADRMTNDLVEPSDEIMPHMHVSDAFHAESALIPVARFNGITNAIVAPDSRDTLPGQDSFIQLAGADASQMLLIRDLAMPLNFTGRQRRNESFASSSYPSTRMGMAAQMRQAFTDAQGYAAKWDEYNKKKAAAKSTDTPPSPPSRDLKLEALLPYLDGKKSVIVKAEEPNDVETAFALAQEFKLHVILNGLTHSQAIFDKIAAWKVPVILGSIYDDPKAWQRYDAVYKVPGELSKRGVKIAFASFDAHQVRNLPYAAGFAVAFGLPYDEAMKALTLYPAQIWGVDDQLGSLDVGKTANVVVANGDPLDVKTVVEHVFIQGRDIPMVNRQTELRDRYTKQQ